MEIYLCRLMLPQISPLRSKSEHVWRERERSVCGHGSAVFTRLVAMGHVYQQLCSGDLWGGVALARAARWGCGQCHLTTNMLVDVCREVWPDDVFGSVAMASEDEVESLRLLLLNPSSGECLVLVPLVCLSLV